MNSRFSTSGLSMLLLTLLPVASVYAQQQTAPTTEVPYKDVRGQGVNTGKAFASSASEGRVILLLRGNNPQFINDAMHAMNRLFNSGFRRIGVIHADGPDDVVSAYWAGKPFKHIAFGDGGSKNQYAVTTTVSETYRREIGEPEKVYSHKGN